MRVPRALSAAALELLRGDAEAARLLGLWEPASSTKQLLAAVRAVRCGQFSAHRRALREQGEGVEEEEEDQGGAVPFEDCLPFFCEVRRGEVPGGRPPRPLDGWVCGLPCCVHVVQRAKGRRAQRSMGLGFRRSGERTRPRKAAPTHAVRRPECVACGAAAA